MYLPAMGDLGPTDFNSTKYPGVCKPSTAAALETFKALQRQLNRVAYTNNLGKIGVDGDIGPGTIALFQKVQAAAASDLLSSAAVSALAVASYGSLASCSAIASAADSIGTTLGVYADALGAPASVPSSVVIAPTTLVSSTGQETQVAGTADNALESLGNLGTVEKIAVVGLLGLIGYMAFNRKGRKARRR